MAGKVTLRDGESYHFLGQERGQYSGGDFYVSVSADKAPKFWANNFGQRGLIHLGDMGTLPLDQVPIPESGFNPQGVTMEFGHTYVSLAREGEEDHFVVFRVGALRPGDSVTLEYLYKQQVGRVPPATSEPVPSPTPTPAPDQNPIYWYFEPPLAGELITDVRIRDAIDYAVDERAIYSSLYYLPTGGSITERSQRYDPDRARELVAEAGFPDGFAELCTSGNEISERMFIYLRELNIAVDFNGDSCKAGTIVISANVLPVTVAEPTATPRQGVKHTLSINGIVLEGDQSIVFVTIGTVKVLPPPEADGTYGDSMVVTLQAFPTNRQFNATWFGVDGQEGNTGIVQMFGDKSVSVRFGGPDSLPRWFLHRAMEAGMD